MKRRVMRLWNDGVKDTVVCPICQSQSEIVDRDLFVGFRMKCMACKHQFLVFYEHPIYRAYIQEEVRI